MAYRLLLADDSITIQKVVELTLSEEDFVVTAVGDGAAGLETAKRLVPDIIMADVFMPKMDGYELCARLKKDPALKHIPVMLLAGTFENFDDARAAQSGADDHITKPFESAELISKVKKLVERAKMAPVGAVEAEPLLEAAPFEEEARDETLIEADDLWSVVSMASSDQPLAKATESLSEDELWKRANLVSESDETAAFPQEEEALPWGNLTASPEEAAEEAAVFEEAAFFEEAALPEVALEAEPDVEATAILNLDDLKPSYAWGKEEPSAIGLADVAGPAEVTPFESLDQAAAPAQFSPPPRPAQAAPVPAVSMDLVREEVQRAVREILDKKMREALEGISRDMIEQIIWEVVPDLAEEILVKEIQRLKTGI